MSDKIKVNLSETAKDIEGNPIPWSDGARIIHEKVSWAFMASKAVGARYVDEKEMDFEAGRKRGILARKLFRGNVQGFSIELTPEDIVETKRLFAKRYDYDATLGFSEALGMTEE